MITNEEIRKCWYVLKGMLEMWDYSEIKAADLVEFMDKLESEIKD